MRIAITCGNIAYARIPAVPSGPPESIGRLQCALLNALAGFDGEGLRHTSARGEIGLDGVVAERQDHLPRKQSPKVAQAEVGAAAREGLRPEATRAWVVRMRIDLGMSTHVI